MKLINLLAAGLIKLGHSLTEGFKEARAEFITKAPEAEVDSAINDYRDLVKRNKFTSKPEERNIDYWRKQGYEAFKNAIDREKQTKSMRQQKGKTLSHEGKYIPVFSNDEWEVTIPLDIHASSDIGKNTAWCTTKMFQSNFNNYRADGEMLVYFIHLYDHADKSFAVKVKLVTKPDMANGGDIALHLCERNNITASTLRDFTECFNTLDTQHPITFFQQEKPDINITDIVVNKAVKPHASEFIEFADDQQRKILEVTQHIAGLQKHRKVVGGKIIKFDRDRNPELEDKIRDLSDHGLAYQYMQTHGADKNGYTDYSKLPADIVHRSLIASGDQLLNHEHETTRLQQGAAFSSVEGPEILTHYIEELQEYLNTPEEEIDELSKPTAHNLKDPSNAVMNVMRNHAFDIIGRKFDDEHDNGIQLVTDSIQFIKNITSDKYDAIIPNIANSLFAGTVNWNKQLVLSNPKLFATYYFNDTQNINHYVKLQLKTISHTSAEVCKQLARPFLELHEEILTHTPFNVDPELIKPLITELNRRISN